MIRPTRLTVTAALLALPLAAVPSLFGAELAPVWFGAVGAVAWLLGTEFALLAPARAVSVQVGPPPLLHPGAVAELRIELRTSARYALRVQAVFDVEGPIEPPAPLSFACPAGGAVEVTLPLRAERRGAARVPRVWLRWSGPLRLLSREQVRPLDLALLAIQDLRPVKGQALRFFARREFQLGLKVERFVGDGSEFHALRDHVPGFDRRAVDWKASARHHRLLAREFRAERSHQILFGIDCGRLMGEPLRGVPKVDHAIQAALLLGYVGLKTGDQVGAAAFADRVHAWREPEGGVRAMHALQHLFGAVDYSDAETNFTLALSELGQRLRRRSLVVLFTDFADQITAELMLPSLGALARRHRLLFVALRDPHVAELQLAEPEQRLDVHRSIVAAGLAQERQLVLERIRRRGIQVVDADAAQVGVELINRYLELKRRELV